MTLDHPESRCERGLARLEDVQGSAGVELVASLGDLGRYIVEFAFGDVISRPGLSLRDRELVTIACLTLMAGRETQLRTHLEAGLRAGLSAAELEEVIIQTVPYAGFPTAINALNLLREIES